MRKRRNRFLLIIIGICIMQLTGCKGDSSSNLTEMVPISDLDSADSSMTKADTETDVDIETDAETDTDTAMLSEENQEETGEELEQKESESEADGAAKEVPQLSDTGRRFEDFVPEGWEILDRVELDFNEDGISDYVGVLEASLVSGEGGLVYQNYPRILFAIESDGADGYRLNFQDINLIRARYEGGVYGDPYLPLTAEGTSFTTHTYGGSAWKWSEDFTYTYCEGVWLLTSSEDTYGYGDYITSYSKDDWKSGVGIRKKRSSEFPDMEQNWEQAEYDVVYELDLDEPLTLEQAGKRWWLAPDRVTEWEVEAIVLAADVEPVEDDLRFPDEAYLNYCDEDCVLYTFNTGSDIAQGCCYLIKYCWQDKVLSVLAKEESAIDYPVIYKEKIYYSTDIVENVTYKMMEDGKEQMKEEEDTVGIRLNRMEPDGTGKEVVFEYRYQESGQEIMESRIPYLSLIYEISGDEIIAEVYIGGEPHPIYRMKTDGSGQKKIGQIPKE